MAAIASATCPAAVSVQAAAGGAQATPFVHVSQNQSTLQSDRVAWLLPRNCRPLQKAAEAAGRSSGAGVEPAMSQERGLGITATSSGQQRPGALASAGCRRCRQAAGSGARLCGRQSTCRPAATPFPQRPARTVWCVCMPEGRGAPCKPPGQGCPHAAVWWVQCCVQYHQDGQHDTTQAAALLTPASAPRCPADFAPGTLLGGKYEVVDLLGRGSSGVTYRCRNTTAGGGGGEVAIKCLSLRT